jgi:hypothetical protein
MKPRNEGTFMELTYKIRGADGKEYGPATLVQIKAWMEQGRINLQTEVTRSDINYWSPAGGFSELQPEQQTPPTISAASASGQVLPQGAAQNPQQIAADPATVKALHSGASWFYWIAGLSLINSISALSGSDWRFIFGLGITQIFDGVAEGLPGGGKAIILILDLFVAGLLVMFGVFAYKRHT